MIGVIINYVPDLVVLHVKVVKERALSEQVKPGIRISTKGYFSNTIRGKGRKLTSYAFSYSWTMSSDSDSESRSKWGFVEEVGSKEACSQIVRLLIS